MSDEFVDTRKLKALVRQLPKNDPLRVVIQDEEDLNAEMVAGRNVMIA